MKWIIWLVLLVFVGGVWYMASRHNTTVPFPTNSPSAQQSPLPSPQATNPPDPLDMIALIQPTEGQLISSPLIITGLARGNWFFEASFPLVLTDWDGKIIAEGFATATDEWMTTEYVPFEATLEFERPSYGDRGTLILQKSNPSGLPEHDAAYEITVYFAQ